MTAQKFMNVVRFKLKSDCVDKYFEVIDKTSFEGMIAHLDEVRGFMEELSPELGVTDPVSGNIISKCE